MRQQVHLTGLWRFQPDISGEGEAMGHAAAGCDVRRWREVRVPCRMDTCVNGMEGYAGAGWFRRTFRVPEEWRGMRITVRFEGVNSSAGVWVNGELVGRHEDDFLPFELRIDEQARFGENNVIAVRVHNASRPASGIVREVSLVATPPGYIERAWMAWAGMDGRFVCEVHTGSIASAAHEMRCEMELIAPAGDACGSFAAQVKNGAAHFAGAVTDPQLWSPDTPALYTARIRLGEDSHALRFGFRTIRTEGPKLLLNGKPIFLPGFNRPEDSPIADTCTDLATARADLLDIKKLGGNFVRLCNHPHHPRELDLCDEIGLLAMSEIPLYRWTGHEMGRERSDETLAAAKRQLTAMIERDISHPSIIFWSVSHETCENLSEVAAGNAELCKLARKLDPTRLAVHVSDQWKEEHPSFAADDVICVNGCRGASAPQDPSTSAELWRQDLAALHEKYPNKPVLVTAFGHPALEGVVSGPHGEETQARALEAEFGGIEAPYVCGATIWCYAHHRRPGDSFINAITTSPFGVVTRERRKLPSWNVVQKMFHERQGKPVPADPPRRRAPGDVGVRMVRQHLRDIPQAPMPEGYSIRPMRRTDGALWTDVQRDAEPILTIDDGLFWREFGDDPQAIEWRCFLIYDPRGLAVATISAWYSRDWNEQDWGRIHWVATRPAHRGKGLARAGLTHAMNCLAQWHERAWLVTSSTRLPAIRIYLDYGFVPDIQNEEEAAVWRGIMERLSSKPG